jgi:hypothetical protein
MSVILRAILLPEYSNMFSIRKIIQILVRTGFKFSISRQIAGNWFQTEIFTSST